MPQLTKSFSDQNHSSKARQHARGQFHKNKSFQGPQTTRSESKPLQEKPPIPVSTATKNKLSAFHFDGQANKDDTKQVVNLQSDDEKENKGAKGREPVTEKVIGGPKASQEQPTLPTSARKPFPSTPAGRLALPDLIGMGDVQRPVQSVSPDERIEWDRKEKGLGSESFGVIRRARKRARSSSPTGSSPARALHPQVDPGSELWGRYSFSGPNAPTPQGPSVPALAHLMQTSSPQPTKEGATPRSGNSLRRANSCGNQFPKRRRIGGSQNDDVFTESAAIGPSKLSVLIERVAEGLSQPQGATPANDRTDFQSDRMCSEVEDDSPIQQSRLRESESAPKHGFEEHPTAQPDVDALPALPDHSDSSDYGDFEDDEFDDCLLDVSDPSAQVNSAPIFAPDPPPQARSAVRLETNLPAVAFSRLAEPVPAPQVEKDEFDDSDDDMFEAGLEHIASQFDPQISIAKRTSPMVKDGSGSARQMRRVPSKAESEDEFGDGGLNDDDFEAAEVTATQAIQQTGNSLLPSTQKAAIQRYLVTTIIESEFENVRGRMQQEKVLILQAEGSKIPRAVHLRGIWVETPVTVQAFVHVIGLFDNHGQCVVDDNVNLLILHPDHLISSTVVADSFGCTRRAVLQDRVKATSDSSAPLVYGTILHEIFQAAMLENRWDSEWLGTLIEKTAIRHLEELYNIKKQVPDAVEHLTSKMPELQGWAELFISSQPNPDAKVKANNGETATMCVSKLLDVEEHVWSPMYGLKGNIDATVQVTMQDGAEHRTLTVPFEVKTGKNPSAAHRAQTALYNLLLSDRYDVEIAYGILYYMETSETIRIPAIRHELRHMIMQRNELACFVRERHAQLPPMLKKENMCNRCYAKVPCFIYHKLADDGDGETSGMKAKFDEVVKHLTPKHKEFFLKWDDLLTKEEKESLKFRRELWTMLSSEREKLGRCFSNVIIEPGSAYEEKDNPKINRYRYSLVKPDPPPGFSFLDSQIIVGEPIVISDEKGHFALANGFVTHVRKKRVTVAVDRRLHNARIRQPGFDEIENQVFASIMEVAPEGSSLEEADGKIKEDPIRYRLDKDEFSNGMATVRNNLIQVMSDGSFGSRHIRGLVVDLNEPRFKTQATAYVLQDRENINIDQRRAIQKVMSAEDYALVLGMPGTGKTTTIAHIIRALVSQGKTVLLTSYTHTAVDNILLKLKDDSIPILRLGAIAKVAMEVQEFATMAATTKTSFEEIRHAWHDTPIVATTCLGINHAIFSERTFDYCIVDEASQITLPVCLGPIRLAKTFILVGDHNQLPPLVQNKEALTGGLDISLFKHLSDMHPSSVVYLEHQYRMCEDVMALSNNLIYQGRLKCGSQEVANSRISIPNIDALKSHHYTPSTLSLAPKSFCADGANSNSCWIRHLVDPLTKVSFINTDPLLPLSREEAKGNRIVNPTEATICTQLVESLLTVGVPASSIGIMTHYRSQLSLLKHSMRSHPELEMHTADRFQGRDKDVIILSLVRSNEARSIGELLKDWRRINVAFTRAKTKLLVVGSKETLGGFANAGKHEGEGEEEMEMVGRFVKLMDGKGWIFDLPKDALTDHVFEVGKTQTQTQGAGSGRTTSASQGAPLGVKTDNLGGAGGGNALTAELERKRKGLNESGTYGKENVGLNRSPISIMKSAAGNGRSSLGQLRQPMKRVTGMKPFKQPSMMSTTMDIINDARS
ncbi:Tripartite DNA replication factor [Cadophora gregata]|uniref:Tripartite DNA replication factor n=1 Tax=Cadophora gregata TaxID=51156 RepID=UPI0026DAF6B8|nr:Tripartite DNA replication factor [Cadophora gregata]KAK0117680.1 Tripartite DNA replication factor [Cadophora gregata]